MVQAVAAVWLFTALRSDEISRLQLGCTEWPATDLTDPETGKKVRKEQICYLHIPANRTSPAFKKPVAPYVGKMIAAWEQIRPEQKVVLDRKGVRDAGVSLLAARAADGKKIHQPCSDSHAGSEGKCASA
ncbi:MAG: hypothetical protein ACJ8BW_10700 [Ktedonobacteraceae bacterium]